METDGRANGARHEVREHDVLVIGAGGAGLRAAIEAAERGLSVGVGSLLFLVNVILLSGYTFGCHSMRHLVGGRADCYSCVRGGNARRKAHHWVSVLTGRHMFWAWISLFSVWGADVYVRLVMAGVIPDLQILPFS